MHHPGDSSRPSETPCYTRSQDLHSLYEYACGTAVGKPILLLVNTVHASHGYALLVVRTRVSIFGPASLVCHFYLSRRLRTCKGLTYLIRLSQFLRRARLCVLYNLSIQHHHNSYKDTPASSPATKSNITTMRSCGNGKRVETQRCYPIPCLSL